MSIDMRLGVARLLGMVAVACGFIGLSVGLMGNSWKLGVTGWFAGGTLVAILAVLVLVDTFIVQRRSQT